MRGTAQRLLPATAAVVALLSAGCSGSGQEPELPLDEALRLSFESVPCDTELEYITDMQFSPDGSGELMLIDLYGGYEVAQLGADGFEILASGTVPDVFTEFDAGMLGLALDPDFATNNLFYLAFTRAENHVVLNRYRLDRDDAAATVASAQLIVEIEVPTSPRWHNISALGFEPDGVMWILVGEKGLFDPAQDPTNLLGSLARIVPSREEGQGGYTIPDGAPQYSAEAADEVYAIGVRSPWKGLYHEGRWYYGDVGLDDVEEVNVIERAGQNFGWPEVEGLCALDALGTEPDCSQYDDPWLYYGRSNSTEYVLDDLAAVPTNKRSVYVGWIYQPQPEDPYQGKWNDVLVFGDAYVGFLRGVGLHEGSESWHSGHLEFPGAWGQGPDGYVYVAALSEEPSAENPEQTSGEPSPMLRAVLATTP